MRKQLAILTSLLAIATLLLSANHVTTAQTPTGSPSPKPTATPQTELPPPESEYKFFPETGFYVPAVFAKYWEDNGGLPIFGYPVSEARLEKSRTDGVNYLVQYFERNRFEHHPEFKDTPNEALLGLLGVEMSRERTFPNIEPFTDSPGRVYMEATRHSLGEPFLSYWRDNGGLAIFGYPISEPFDERNDETGRTYLVQYFERNRFEFHPENEPPYHVLLGLLGSHYLDLQEMINPWGSPIPGGLTPVEPIWKPVKPAVGGKFLRGEHVGDGIIVQAYWQDHNRILGLVNDINFIWIKQQVEWKDTEGPKGNFKWDELDNIVSDAQAHKVKVLLSVTKAPQWATGGGVGFPQNPQDFGDFMGAMASRYKGRVGAYEIWNEQNLAGESGDVNPARYVELLKSAYIAIKAADPAAVVVSGAMAPTGINDPQGKRAPGAMGAMPDPLYIEQMYLYKDGEVRRYFDALGTHPYGYNNPPDTSWPSNPNLSLPLADYYNRANSFYFRRIEQQRAIMEKYGDTQKQMWVTEYGWCSDYRPDGYGECRYNTPEQQGQYTVGAMQRSKKYYPWMGVMFLWNLNFSTFQEWYTGPSHFSILNPDWSPRPAYGIIKNRPK